jgi:hypothetical protein
LIEVVTSSSNQNTTTWDPFAKGVRCFELASLKNATTGWRYGYLDKNGAEAVPAVFHYACSFSESLAAAKVGNLRGYIDPSGLFKITPRFEGTRREPSRLEETKAGYFVNGLAPVWSGHGDGFLDTAGKFVIEGGFDEAMNLHGQMVIEPLFYSPGSFQDGLCLVETEDSIGYINKTGRVRLEGPSVEYGVVL